MNTLQIHEIGFGILPETRKRSFFHGTKTETGLFRLAKPSAPSVWSGKLTQDQVVSKLQLMDLDITRSIYSQIEGGTYSIRISVLSGLSRIFQVGL